MKCLGVLGATFVALVAVSALTVSSASATTFLAAEWLLNGLTITTAISTEAPGEIDYINTNGGGFGIRTQILCSWILDGTAGPKGADTTTKILSLTGEEITSTKTLNCANTEGCEGALVYAVNLPWKTELELIGSDTGEPFVDLLINAGYKVSCTVLGVKIEEECVAAETAIEQTNVSGGVKDVFSEAFRELAGTKKGNCSAHTEVVSFTGEGVTKPTAGGTLTVSE
jgi:hypothetical protein